MIEKEWQKIHIKARAGEKSPRLLKIIFAEIYRVPSGKLLWRVSAVPPEVNKVIVETVKIPIISLGSGVYGAGQCLIVHDMLGFFDRFTPKFVKKYANLNAEIVKALETYVADVKGKGFPGPEHVYPMSQEEVKKFLAKINN